MVPRGQFPIIDAASKKRPLPGDLLVCLFPLPLLIRLAAQRLSQTYQQDPALDPLSGSGLAGYLRARIVGGVTAPPRDLLARSRH